MKIKSTIKAFFFGAVCLICTQSSATIHTVNVANFSFSPSNIPNVMVGDVVRFVWVSGTHTSTSSSVPSGAATWDANINSSSTSFDYNVTKAGTYNYGCSIHPGMLASFTASAVLPVKLLAFKVVTENNIPVLKWTTSSEDNIDYFSVQKSKTGNAYEEVGRVKAAGNSSVLKNYVYTDQNVFATDQYCYYIIAIVDKEGRKEFSPVALFRNKLNLAKIIISLSPNPVNRAGHLMVKFNAERTDKMNVRLSDNHGRMIMETTMQSAEGVNNGHLMLGELQAGSYNLSFEQNGLREIYKIIVM